MASPRVSCRDEFAAVGVRKRVKNDWRYCLSNDSLNALLRISIDGPSTEDFVADQALELWWNQTESSRRPNFHRY